MSNTFLNKLQNLNTGIGYGSNKTLLVGPLHGNPYQKVWVLQHPNINIINLLNQTKLLYKFKTIKKNMYCK